MLITFITFCSGKKPWPRSTMTSCSKSIVWQTWADTKKTRYDLYLYLRVFCWFQDLFPTSNKNDVLYKIRLLILPQRVSSKKDDPLEELCFCSGLILSCCFCNGLIPSFSLAVFAMVSFSLTVYRAVPLWICHCVQNSSLTLRQNALNYQTYYFLKRCVL